jgi:hypothetical protein
MKRPYNEAKNKILLNYIIEYVKKERSNKDIDDTITVSAETDLKEVISECEIINFSFERVKGLRKELSFESYKIMYKDDKTLKVIIDKDGLLGFDKVPLKYM